MGAGKRHRNRDLPVAGLVLSDHLHLDRGSFKYSFYPYLSSSFSINKCVEGVCGLHGWVQRDRTSFLG